MEDVSVLLLLLSWGLEKVVLGAAEGVAVAPATLEGGEGVALPVNRMFLKASTSSAALPLPLPAPCLCSFPCSSAFSRINPTPASLLANVFANGLYGALISLAGALSGEGSDPEFLVVFFNASSSSESAVAVESDSSPLSSTVVAGGGGDPALPLASAADSLLAPLPSVNWASGESGGVWILTRFFFVRFAAAESSEHDLPAHKAYRDVLTRSLTTTHICCDWGCRRELFGKLGAAEGVGGHGSECARPALWGRHATEVVIGGW